jgi:serine/threonine protein kinase
MHMVVMDYILPQSNAPPDVRGQIQTVLTLLHSEGYIFGDLRKQNILFDADGKAKLIDFNWCGRYDMNIRDETNRQGTGPD